MSQSDDLRDGDLLLVRGRDKLSESNVALQGALKQMNKNPRSELLGILNSIYIFRSKLRGIRPLEIKPKYSHVAMVVGPCLAIHSIPKTGVDYVGIGKLLDESVFWEAWRLVTVQDDDSIRKAANFCSRKTYNFKIYITRSNKFDYEYENAFCSELVEDIYRRAGYDTGLSDKNLSKVLPSDFEGIVQKSDSWRNVTHIYEKYLSKYQNNSFRDKDFENEYCANGKEIANAQAVAGRAFIDSVLTCMEAAMLEAITDKKKDEDIMELWEQKYAKYMDEETEKMIKELGLLRHDLKNHIHKKAILCGGTNKEKIKMMNKFLFGYLVYNVNNFLTRIRNSVIGCNK
ncbi:hypothetical protein G9409_03560 [Chlorobium sp. BLA1]|uniref:hypothetical protein n=1 Tax=Candidatus Chlorobium masyuteum TaxID=2716876 RepID=UPI00141F9C0A|nr:hypothetical protein [Candidatus Chlorobium masyuteum]NHQ59672.1 hypothetical protein [Candidatus Chlorobium masyuteum]